uniref:Rab-GAP TBC domain-containing protein n=1 Tax=Heterosigma akashiwo TaxID=2829 RepID=A0A7S3XZV6_HETAK
MFRRRGLARLAAGEGGGFGGGGGGARGRLGQVLTLVLMREDPVLCHHLADLGVQPGLYACTWVETAFTAGPRGLPQAVRAAAWDAWLATGRPAVLLQVAVAIIIISRHLLLHMEEGETIQYLTNLSRSEETLGKDAVLSCALNIDIEDDVMMKLI